MRTCGPTFKDDSGRGLPILWSIARNSAQRPTRGDLAKIALGIIFCSAVLITLFVWIAWH